MSAPEMRAAHVRENLAQLRALGTAVEAEVRARCRPEALAAIEHSARVAWLPVELDVALTEAIFAVVGERAGREWARRAMLATIDSPLLRPLVGAAVKIFGLRPDKLFGWLPRGWDNVYRGCGALEVDVAEPGVVRVHHRGIPPAIQSRAYLLGMVGAFEALLDVCRATGTCELRWQPGADACEYHVEWAT